MRNKARQILLLMIRLSILGPQLLSPYLMSTSLVIASDGRQELGLRTVIIMMFEGRDESDVNFILFLTILIDFDHLVIVGLKDNKFEFNI